MLPVARILSKQAKLTCALVNQGTRASFATTRLRNASSTHQPATRYEGVDLKNFDPNNYNVPLRAPDMDDLMEPYGSWKVAYEAERRHANRTLLMGIVSLSATLSLMYMIGIFEPLLMPNLDNIMEETESFHQDLTDRVTVK